MHFLERSLDRFCRKHPGFGVPNLMLIIIFGTAAIYLLDSFGAQVSSFFSFVPALILQGQVWRLFTFVLVPMSSSPLTLLLTLYMLWWMGRDLERTWGTARFTLFYLVGLGMNAVAGFLLCACLPGGFSLPYVTANAYYLNLSFFFALATLYPDATVLLFFFLPVKFKWLGWVDAAIFLLGILRSAMAIPQGLINLVGVVSPLIAIFNYLLFFWSDITGFLGRIFHRAGRRPNHKTIPFQETAQQLRHQKGYIHKCAVCGKTDAEFPQEEFRYCSKCDGNYCYCSEHLTTHVHIRKKD